MDELRYSIKTASKFLNLTTSEIYRRAHYLRLDTKHGLSAKEINRIGACELKRKRGNCRATLDDLKKEMEALRHE